MADRKITTFDPMGTLKSNSIFAVVDPDEGAPDDQNKKITASDMLSFFAAASHTHTGVYEPAFSKNTAFNKNFAGTGAATTVARSDHTHVLANMTEFSMSAYVAQDVLFYNGSKWTNYPIATYRSLVNYWSINGTKVYYSAGDVGIGTSAPLVDLHVRIDDNATSRQVFFGTEDGNYGFQFKNAAPATGFRPQIWLFPHGSTNFGSIETQIDVGDDSGTTEILQLKINSDSGTIANRDLLALYNDTTKLWAIDKSGYHGLGVADPTVRLDVNGDIKLSGQIILSSVTTDTGFATSRVLTRDSSGNVDAVVASGGGTTNFLRADGTWATPPGTGGGGDVYKVGTPVDNQVVIWTGDGTAEGTSTFTFAAGVLGLTGDFTMSGTLTAGNFKMTNAPTDTTFASSKIVVRDSNGNLELLPVSGGSEDLALKGDGTWDVLWPYVTTPVTANGVTATFDPDGIRQWIIAVTTDDTTSTWTLQNMGLSMLFFIKKTDPTAKAITLTGANMVFININNKVATTAALSTLVITLDDLIANYSYELSIIDSGLLEGSDHVIHVSLK